MSVRNAKAPVRLPSLDLLKGFEAAARLLSFTRAGEELHLTQSAVSRQIQELEEQLGVQLFHRRHRSLALTEAGQQLYGPTTQVLGTMRAAVERLRTLGGRRVVAVTTTVSFATLWLVPRLAAYRRIAPEVDVRISADSRFVDLEREGFDIGLRMATPQQAGEQAIALFGERVFPVASPQLLRDPARPLRTPADLAHHTLLEADDPHGRWPWLAWRQWLEVAGLVELKPQATLRFSEYNQIVDAARAAMGVALGRSALIQAELAAGRLVAPFKGEITSTRKYYVVVSRLSAERPEVKQFVDWLRAEAASEVPAGSRPRARPAARAA